MPSIGEKIRQIRRQRGLTQAELSDGIVSPSMISQIESDKTRPSYPLIRSIANRLGMPVEHFLNEFEDHFATSAKLRLAEFWFLIGDYEQVHKLLEKLTIPDVPGHDFFEYRLLLARLYRVNQDYSAAARTLEELREAALKNQERRLLFFVMKESGHIEYAMNNPDGAMHEWTIALEIVETFLDTSQLSTPQFNYEVTDICLRLHELHKERGNKLLANQYLKQAEQHTEHSRKLSEIAKILVKDGINAIKEDSSRAKALIDSGVNLLEFTLMVEQYIYTQTKLDINEEKPVEVSELAVRTTTTLNPERFIAGEVSKIEQFVEDGKTVAAESRIKRCREIIEDYKVEITHFRQQVTPLFLRLGIAEAQVLHQLDRPNEAISLLRKLSSDVTYRPYRIEVLKIFRLLVQWVEEVNGEHAASELANEAKKILFEDIATREAPPG